LQCGHLDSPHIPKQLNLGEMKPDKLTIDDLFQRDRRYVVPLYQRAYVWTREDQWEPLWDDIEQQAEACLAEDGLISRRSHFLGAIVLNVSRIIGKGVARSEIIDGQQRLTTLQIVIAAMRDFAEQINSEHVARLRGLTANQYEKFGSDAMSAHVVVCRSDKATTWRGNELRRVVQGGSYGDLMLWLGWGVRP
jgi:hypothetical protein